MLNIMHNTKIRRSMCTLLLCLMALWFAPAGALALETADLPVETVALSEPPTTNETPVAMEPVADGTTQPIEAPVAATEPLVTERASESTQTENITPVTETGATITDVPVAASEPLITESVVESTQTENATPAIETGANDLAPAAVENTIAEPAQSTGATATDASDMETLTVDSNTPDDPASPADIPGTLMNPAHTSVSDNLSPADLKSDIPDTTVNTSLLPETRSVSTESDNTVHPAAGARNNNAQTAADKPLLADDNGLLADKPSTLEVGPNEVLVEAYALGATRDKALQAAFMEAITKVNGATLTNNDVLEIQYKLDAAVEMNGNSGIAKTGVLENAESATFGYGNQVIFITNGLLKSYEVISEGRVNKDYEISIRALVAKYTPGVETQRQRIAVMPFRILNASGWQALYSEFFTQQLTDYLTQTKRFAVLDRKFMAEKYDEFNVLSGADTPTSERVRIGNTLGADYMVVGQINKLDYILKEEQLPYMKSMQYVLTGRTSFTFRVIVPATGQVVASKTYNEKTEIKFDSREGLKLEDLEQAEIDQLAAKAAYKAGQDIMNELYPLMAINYNGSEFTVNQGGDSLKTGQQYTLRVYGEMLVDPYSKEELGRDEKTIGTVQITEVLPRYSRAKTLELNTQDDIALLVKAGMVILRPVAETAPVKSAPPQSTTNRPKW